MNNKIKEKYLKIIVPLVIGLLFLIIIWLGYKFLTTKKKTFLEEIDKTVYANITHDAIYGIHFNLKGTFQNIENVSNLKLILKDNKNEIDIPITTKEKEDEIEFTTSNFINKGLNLEYLPTGTYYLLLKGTITQDNKTKDVYYSVTNKTNYENLEYYTISKNNKNNKINIEWNTYEECPTLRFKIEETNLPENVYDITIDPGHGGSDVGAIGTLNNKEYHESDLNLKVSLKLKEILEQRGYKVAITRTDDSFVEIYETGGSATLANDTKSKFNFAIHHNSFAYESEELKGLEVYVASDIEFDFANILIKNIVEYANTQISPKSIYQVAPGIYQRYFTEEEIEEDEVQPSNKDTSMIYYYNIRELGGISTKSTQDGRYLEVNGYPPNPYNKSNNTTEPYLLELGYVNNQSDLKNILGNEEKYATGIANAIEEYLNTNY